jgi:hypothetical protein
VLRQQVDQNINLELQKRELSLNKEFDAAHSSINQTVNLNDTVIITPLNQPRKAETFSDTLL